MNHSPGLEIPRISSFPLLLMDILDKSDTSDIASWLPGERAFIIHNKKRFGSELLPVYFKQAKYSSFARRMKRWGFILDISYKKSCNEIYGSKSVYHHPLFLRSSKSLCLQMRPKPQKKYVRKKQNYATTKSGRASAVSNTSISMVSQLINRSPLSTINGPQRSATSPGSSVLAIEAGTRPMIDSSFERRLKEDRFQQDLLLQQVYHQQEVSTHDQYLQDSAEYRQLYESHLARIAAQHRFELEIEAKFSALVHQNLTLKTILVHNNEMDNTMGRLR